MLFGSRAFLNQAVLNSLLDMLEEKGVIDREDHIQIYRNAGWKEIYFDCRLSIFFFSEIFLFFADIIAKTATAAAAAAEISFIILGSLPEAFLVPTEVPASLILTREALISVVLLEFSGAIEMESDVGNNIKEKIRIGMKHFNLQLFILPL